MNNTSSKLKIAGLSALAAAFLLSSVAFAVATPDRENPKKDLAQARLQDAKLRSCQAREKGIQNRSANLIRMAENMQDKFESIAQRIQDYYTNTVVPSGSTVASYDSLVVDIQAKKAVVQAAIVKTQSDFDGFSCTTDDPKGEMRELKENMQAVKKALKDYRTSIKNLIVAVRSAQETDSD